MTKVHFAKVSKSLLCVVCSILFFSCQVGLGEAVDTQPPRIAVSLPEADTVIREQFTMSGTCSDEQGLRNVVVVLRNTSTGVTYPEDGTYKAKVNKDQDSWTCDIDPLDKSLGVPDGSYEATVTATDKSGRTTIATKSFVIDNTPPFLVLTRPSTKLTDSSFDSYGQEFSITGQVADDNNIDKLIVSVYDKETDKKIRDIELNNVPPTIDLSVAKWGAENGYYKELYGSDYSAGTKRYYCTLSIYDNAVHCPPIENDSGNSSSVYYLYNDIYDDVLSSYKVTEVYHILNNTYTPPRTNVSRSAQASSVRNEVVAVLENEAFQSKTGTFCLNPANNPSYTLTGFDTLGHTEGKTKYEELRTLEKFQVLSGSAITLKLSSGLDKSPIKKDTVAIYLLPYDNATGALAENIEENRVYLVQGGKILVGEDEDIGTEIDPVGSYDYTATLSVIAGTAPGLEIKKAYIVYVTGEDKSGIRFVNNDTYGFYLQTNGSAPSLQLTEPAKNTIYVQKGQDVKIKGKVTSGDAVTISARLSSSAAAIDSIHFDGNASEAEWGYLTIPAESFSQTQSNDYTVVVEADNGRVVERQFTVIYDVLEPEISISSILPEVETFSITRVVEDGIQKHEKTSVRKDNINGTVTINVNLSDDYGISTTQPTVIQFLSDTQVVDSRTTTAKVIRERFDTTSWSGVNNQEVTLSITTYDIAGNSHTQTETLFINQDSDKPTIEYTAKNFDEIVKGVSYTSEYPAGAIDNMVISGAPITATITDDDGIGEITVKIFSTDGTLYGNAITLSSSDITSNPYPLSITSPSVIGDYYVEISVKDTSAVQTEYTQAKSKVYFTVDTGNPTIRITKDSAQTAYYGKTDGPIATKGVVSGLSGLKVYRAQNAVTANEAASQPDSDGTWKDTFTVPANAAEGAELTAKYYVHDVKDRWGEAEFTYTVDNTKPVVTIANTITDGLISASSYKFYGTATDEKSGVKSIYYTILPSGSTPPAVPAEESAIDTDVWANSFEGSQSSSSDWEFYKTFVPKDSTLSAGQLEEGSYVLYVCAFDVAQNASLLKSLPFTADLNPPAISEASYVESGRSLTLKNNASVSTTKKQFTLSGSVSDTYRLKKLELTAKSTAAEKTLFSYDLDDEDEPIKEYDWSRVFVAGSANSSAENYIADGIWELTLTVTDAAGRKSSAIYSITIDTAAPVLSTPKLEYGTASASANGFYSYASPVLTITAIDETSGISEIYCLASTTQYDSDTIKNAGIDSKMNSTGTANQYSRRLSLNDGISYIYVRAVDEAGNEAIYGVSSPIVAKVDTMVPSIKFIKPDSAGGMVSSKVALAYEVSVSDELSGAAGTTATVAIGSYSANVTVANGKITGSIPAATTSALTGDSASLTVTAKDAAGNSATGSVIVQFDNVPPTVSFTNPVSSTVNGKITISGTTTENVGLESVKLYRSAKSGETADITVSGSGYKLLQTFTGTAGYSWQYNVEGNTAFDTSSFDGTTVTFYAVATDTASNEGTATKAVTVDQDSDRPEILFKNMTLESMSGTNFIKNKAEEIYGDVTDDDGVAEFYISTDGGTTWGTNLYDSGWTYKFTQDGSATLAFKVVDSAGSVFISATGTDMKNSVKLKDTKGNTYGYKVSGSYPATSDTHVYVTTDTQNPILKTAYYFASAEDLTFAESELNYTSLDSRWQEEGQFANDLFGGTNGKLYVLIAATDTNGISDISASLANKTGTLVKSRSQKIGGVEGLVSVIKFDVSSGSGYQTLKYTATDTSSRTATTQVTLQLDNTGPNISITSHRNGTQVYGTAPVNVRGAADDIAKLYLAKTATSAAPAADDWAEISDYTSPYAFSVLFTGGTNAVGGTDYYDDILNVHYAALYGTITDDSATKPVYIWFYGEDSLGNTGDPVYVYLNVNPNGDQPSVSISYPTEELKVGGTVRITGSSAIEDVTGGGVQAIYLQIDPEYNGTSFNENWKSAVESRILDNEGNYTVDYRIEANSLIPGGYGIKASGSVSSWNLPINTAKEFESSENVTVAVRAYAITGAKCSEPETVWFVIDANTPVIGDSEKGSLKLVKRQNDSPTGKILMTRDYTADMWINGVWYLTGSIYDDSGLKKVLWKSGSTSESLIGTNKIIVDGDNKPSDNTGCNNYTLNIPVGKSSGFGSLSYTLEITENTDNNLSSSAAISLNYDNTAPTFAAALAATGNQIQQSNGTYTMTGTFNENSDAFGNNQSGFERIALYFTRTLDGTTYVIDPMLSGGVSGDNNRYAADSFTYNSDDGIYWLKKTVSSFSADTLTLSDLPGDNIRKGGLCKINDIVYRIDSVDYAAGTVTLGTAPADSSITEAYFALAQVIDNLTNENFTTAAYDKSISSLPASTNDDGDQMVEGVSRSGTTWTWNVSIDSSLILDGPVDIHFVAYDKAGNIAKETYSGTVSNNQPRIVGVVFGTDQNGNDSVEDSELVKSYSGLYTTANTGLANGYRTAIQKVDSIDLGSSDSAAINVKGALLVRPEIVGGNKGIKYNYSVTKNGAGTAYVTASDLVSLSTAHASGNEVRSGTTALSDIKLSLADMLGANIADEALQKFTFTLWDETEGTVAGSTSQKATVNLYANVSLRDETKPTVVIYPFYWKSASDNSLFNNSSANGHIELEGDLDFTGSPFTATSGEFDKDPKVSGMITLRGKANDNALLKTISVTVSGFNGGSALTLGTYEAGSGWTLGSTLTDGAIPATGWASEIVNETFTNASGHTVEWLLHLNTALISGTAAPDVKVTATATDRGKATLSSGSISYTANTSAASTTQTKGTAGDATNTPYYRVDVVPYITKLSTPNRAKSGLKDNNIRSASGKYSIMYADEANSTENFISVEGFNLNPSAVRVVNSSTVSSTSVGTTSGVAVSYTNTASDYTSFSASNYITKSGYLEVFVNGVRSLNNLNNNDGYGTATNSVNTQLTKDNATVTDYAAAYNREPDYYNTKNVRLTDDRYLRLWNMHDTGSRTKNGQYPTLFMEGDEPVFGYFNPSGGPAGDIGDGPNTGAGPNATSGNTNRHPEYAMPQRIKFDADGIEKYTEYLCKISAGDQMGSGVDDSGRYYHFSVFNRGSCAAYMIYDRYNEFYTNGKGWGPGITIAPIANYVGAANNNGISLESINYGDLMAGRYQYPKIIAKGRSKDDVAYVYVAYYDDYYGSIVMRTFQCGTTVTGSSYVLDSSHKDLAYSYDGGAMVGESGRSTYAQKINFAENSNTGNNVSATWGVGRLIGTPDGVASKYFDMKVSSDYHIVLVWYDENESSLRLRYSASPVIGDDPSKEIDWVDSNITNFPKYVGNYVSMDLDSTGGVHISAFDANDSNLVYMYLPHYDSTALESYTVDQASAVGNWTQIKVNSNNVPYIAYYNATETGSRDSIKLAWANAQAGSVTGGVEWVPGSSTGVGYTTGGWEYMTVPAVNPPQGGSPTFQNVCLAFDTAGTPVVGYAATNLEFGKQLGE